MSVVRPEFELLVQEIKNENKTIKILPKQILYNFYCERRTKYNNIIIRNYLNNHGLETYPDFVSSYLWANVELRVKAKVRVISENQEEYDPINRITLLPAANRVPCTINRDAKLSVAVTEMMLNGYSQLPVTSDNRKIDGLITWQSIGQKLIQQSDDDCVRSYMTQEVEIIKYDNPLFDSVTRVIEKEVVLIKGVDGALCGLVTTADISDQFILLTEPFLILEEIENHVRKILDNQFTIDEIQNLAQIQESSKEINLISDLTFGQYIRIMEAPDNWNRLNLKIDRQTFIKRLDIVRRIRNDVMHFHPDGISDNDKQTLRDTAKFFSTLSKYVN